MWKILSILQKKLIIAIPLAMLFGLIVGYFFDTSSLKSLILPLTFLMVYPMMVTMNMKELFTRGDEKVQIVAQIINFLIFPFTGFLIGRIFFPENAYLVLGLLLASLIPTSGMTISWTGFSNGNISAAVKMTIIGLVMGAILTPLYIKLLMGTSVSISLISIFLQIITVIFIPMLGGYITQTLLKKKYGMEKFKKEIKPKFPPLSSLGVLIVIFVSMSLKSKNIMVNPEEILYMLIPIIILYVLNYTISTIIARLFFQRPEAIALVYGTVLRNLSIALAIAISVFKEEGSEIALIIAIAYIIQSQSAAWYKKLFLKDFEQKSVKE